MDLDSGKIVDQISGIGPKNRDRSRLCEERDPSPVIARSDATKQSQGSGQVPQSQVGGIVSLLSVARNTSCTCGTLMGMKVLHAPVIASTRRVRGNLTVLVPKDSGIASVALLPRNDPGLSGRWILNS